MAELEIRENGSHLTVSPGDRLVIRLPENGSTGYQWSVTELGEALELVSDDYLLPGEIRPGAGGERVVVLRAVGRGEARVSLQHKAEWKPEPIDHFSATVTVKDGE